MTSEIHGISIPRLFFIFVRNAGLVFGGAASIGPTLERELVDQRQVLEREEFWIIFGLSQMMPSIILANLAISLGNRLRGPMGAVAALSGMLLPAVLGSLALTFVLLAGQDLEPIKAGMYTTLPAVIGVVGVAAFRLARHHGRRRFNLALMAIVAIGLVVGISPLILIVGSGAIGIAFPRSNRAS